MKCPVCGTIDKLHSTRNGDTWYCPYCLSILVVMGVSQDAKQEMPDWDPNNRPKCIYCGQNDNVYRTIEAGEFYCIGCDTYFRPMDFPECPKCNRNDEITTKSEGRYPHRMPAYARPGQYTCHRCELIFDDQTILYRKLRSDPGYDDCEESSSSNYDEVEEYDDYSGEDNPSEY